MGKINFVREIASHVIWNIRLRCFIDGGDCASREQIVSHEKCCLGKWIYKEGLRKYGKMAEMQEFEKVHKEMHAKVARIVEIKETGDIRLAKRELETLRTINERIIILLSDIQRRIKQKKQSTKKHNNYGV